MRFHAFTLHAPFPHLINACLNVWGSAQLPFLSKAFRRGLRNSRSSSVLPEFFLTCPSPPLLPRDVALSTWYSSLYLTLYPRYRRHSITDWSRNSIDFMGATLKFRVICLGLRKVLVSLPKHVFSNSQISTILTCFPLKEWKKYIYHLQSSVLGSSSFACQFLSKSEC